MSDQYQPPQPAPEPQIYPPVEPQPQPMPPVEAAPPLAPLPEEKAFTAFPYADENQVQAAEQKAAEDPNHTGVVVNPGPQLSDTAPDQNTEPAMPPPPVNP